VILTRTGKAYPLNVADIPSGSSRSRGTPLITLLPPSAAKDESVSRQELVLTQFIAAEHPNKTDIITLTQQGKIKRLPLTEFTELTNRGMTVVKLKDEDELSYAVLCQPQDLVVIATSGGRLLRLPINDEQLPIMGRTAQGSQVTRLRKQEQLVGCVTASTQGSLLLVSEKGDIKRIGVNQLRSSRRGAIGTQVFQFKQDADRLMGLVTVKSEQVIHLLTSENRLVNFASDSIKLTEKDAAGDRLLKLAKGETILEVRTE
jgi:DNA gyrase subunit A